MEVNEKKSIVGNRFLSVVSQRKLKVKEYKLWDWQSGVVRAASERNINSSDLQVLVEFDGEPWHNRRWIKISECEVFCVEESLVLVSSLIATNETSSTASVVPALVFTALHHTGQFSKLSVQPVEYLVSQRLAFLSSSQFRPYQEEQDLTPEFISPVTRWQQGRAAQQIFLETPSILVGYRVQVYRVNGPTQWFTAVVQGYNEKTQKLTFTSDTVLEVHNEDPALLQISLLGNGVLEALLKGEHQTVRISRRSTTDFCKTAIRPDRGSKKPRNNKKNKQVIEEPSNSVSSDSSARGADSFSEASEPTANQGLPYSCKTASNSKDPSVSSTSSPNGTVSSKISPVAHQTNDISSEPDKVTERSVAEVTEAIDYSNRDAQQDMYKKTMLDEFNRSKESQTFASEVHRRSTHTQDRDSTIHAVLDYQKVPNVGVSSQASQPKTQPDGGSNRADSCIVQAPLELTVKKARESDGHRSSREGNHYHIERNIEYPKSSSFVKPETTNVSLANYVEYLQNSHNMKPDASSRSPAGSIEPYRDPELLKEDHLRQQAMRAVPIPASAGLPQMSSVPNAAQLILGSGFPYLTPPTALNSLPNSSPHLTPQQLLMLQMAHLQQMPIQMYPALSAMHIRRLEVLWNQKYPTIAVPPVWMLLQYQDELLNDAVATTSQHQRELVEHAMRAHERLWREQTERQQQERLEQERQEKERKERERMEKERERMEKERLERERAEQEDKIKREKELQEKLERDRERREILHESKAAADAVNQHFQESLNRLKYQQHQEHSTAMSSAKGSDDKSSAATFRSTVLKKVYHQPLPVSALVASNTKDVKPSHLVTQASFQDVPSPKTQITQRVEQPLRAIGYPFAPYSSTKKEAERAVSEMNDKRVRTEIKQEGPSTSPTASEEVKFAHRQKPVSSVNACSPTINTDDKKRTEYGQNVLVQPSDSFKSLVENTVISAFNEPELNKPSGTHLAEMPGLPVKAVSPVKVEVLTAANSVPCSLQHINKNVSSSAATIPSSTVDRTSLDTSCSTVTTNGSVDTDSDTLSANSPLPHTANTVPSPVLGQQPGKFKKALLARYAGPDDNGNVDSKDVKFEPTDGTTSNQIQEQPASQMDVQDDICANKRKSLGEDGPPNKRPKLKGKTKAVQSVDSDQEMKAISAPDTNPASTTWHCEIKMLEAQHKGKAAASKKNKNKSGLTESPSSILANKPLNNMSLDELKASKVAFLQADSCSEIAPRLARCRECKTSQVPIDRGAGGNNIFCRFFAFRRLKFNAKSVITNAGFSEPSDADAKDLNIWYPRYPPVEPAVSVAMAKYLLLNMGDRFCELVEQEKEAVSWAVSETKTIWKRAVQGVREMCDVCETTLFNIHWCCTKCGFVVCIDCYRNKDKRTGCHQDRTVKQTDSDLISSAKWLPCSANNQHEANKLRITQIIPSDVLWALGSMLHIECSRWHISSNCKCPSRYNGTDLLLKAASQALDNKDEKLRDSDQSVFNHSNSALSILAEAAESESKRQEQEAAGEKPCSTLRDLLTRKTLKAMQGDTPKSLQSNTLPQIADIAEKLTGGKLDDRVGVGSAGPVRLLYYVPLSGSGQMLGRASPIPTYTLNETSVLFPQTPHSWLDNGRLLLLTDPQCTFNLELFQQQWRRGQPVMVANCHRTLMEHLWSPEAFMKEFGHLECELWNCSKNTVVQGHKMRAFWEGFEQMSCRLKDRQGRPMILKLKDWPPTEDFAETMPDRFENLMSALPLPEYISRTGVFNLASRLPDYFVKPDLGPKMYNAYGSSLEPDIGSTNLHLDISDAANLMLYVALPRDDKERHQKASLDIMKEANCCPLTIERATKGEIPGALWHIFDPQDADKIRDLLNKVASERGEDKELYHDPIHDQSWFLDTELIDRLWSEYEVQAYTTVQFVGDAIFIPAGAPHQVKNLNSCIKAAEDFVSPENINHCFRMTQEFRCLSDTHSNHEDKLQIKNIIYHAVKDAVAVLKHHTPEEDAVN